jgi:putative tryptophan/tyrosine transport system substrate-binding protein
MPVGQTNRRAFIAALGGAAVWPVVARGQSPTPVIGFLGTLTLERSVERLVAFRDGLRSVGFDEGRNVVTEYRWAEGDYSRLAGFAAELAQSKVAVIVASSPPGIAAAMQATSTIPIVFGSGTDPVASGLVSSMNKPEGNATGVFILTNALEPKRHDLLHQLLPDASLFAVFLNPKSVDTETELKIISSAARNLGVELIISSVSSTAEIEAAFAGINQSHARALLIGADPFLSSHSNRIIELAAHFRVPTVYEWREAVLEGGLMSYGTSLTRAFRQMGTYCGLILRGAKPSDLPVVQQEKLELVLNLKTAKALGLTVPIALLGRADEVIE